LTGFDILAGLVLLVSGLVGYARGATREVTTVIAFLLAVAAAVIGLRFTSPIARHFIHTPWMANAAAALALFIVAYIAFRMVGGALTRSVRQTATLSGVDRVLGFGIGLIRGLVVLGAFALLIDAATPPERKPAWFLTARLYPLARASGAALEALAPKGLEVAHSVAPVIHDAVDGVDDTASPSPAQPGARPARPHPRGYSDDQRKSLDDLVEKSR
jgi:membrane protein required for colicin V production